MGGVQVRWLREREEYLRNHQMGCLSLANRMHISPNEGVVHVLASPTQYGLTGQLSSDYLSAVPPFTALTLWNSLAASR